MKSTAALSRAIRLRMKVEQRFAACLSALDTCSNADEKFLNEVIEIEIDLKNLIRRENFLTDQVRLGMMYTGVSLEQFEEKYA